MKYFDELKRTFGIIFFIWLSFSSFGVPHAFSQIKQELANKDGWSYGKSRAGVKDKDHPMPTTGWLTFNHNPVPVNLQRRDIVIISPPGTFQYKILEDDFEDYGWFKVSDIRSTDAPVGKDSFSEDDLKRGFYFGSFNERRKSTPASWVFIQGVAGYGQWLAWVDSNRLAEFALNLINVPPIFFVK